MSLLAKLIAKEEGFGKPGAIPTTHNNPGDLRHSPHSQHPGDPNAIGQIDTPEHGWEDLEGQIILDEHRHLTLRQFVAKFAPASENNTARYLQDLCVGLVADQTLDTILQLTDRQPPAGDVLATNPQPSGADVVSVLDGPK